MRVADEEPHGQYYGVKRPILPSRGTMTLSRAATLDLEDGRFFFVFLFDGGDLFREGGDHFVLEGRPSLVRVLFLLVVGHFFVQVLLQAERR